MKEKESTEITSNSFRCIDAIEVSLCIEKQGLVFYEKASKNARDPDVKKIFLQLAEEEKEHMQSLQTKARFLQPALLKKSSSRKHIEQLISEQLKGKVFPEIKSGGNESSPRITNDMEALEFGIESEKRSIQVLSELLTREKKIDVRAIFSHLLAEEKKHLAALEELKRSFSSKTT